MKKYLMLLAIIPFLLSSCGQKQEVLVPVETKMPILTPWKVEPLMDIHYKIKECTDESCRAEA